MQECTGFSLCIAKISQGLRKFRNHSENLSFPAKFSLCTFFQPRSFSFLFHFALFSLFFLSFSRLPNTPLEDDNSRDVWLSIKALKRRVACLVNGGLVGVPQF